jgi:hypothetical protein
VSCNARAQRACLGLQRSARNLPGCDHSRHANALTERRRLQAPNSAAREITDHGARGSARRCCQNWPQLNCGRSNSKPDAHYSCATCGKSLQDNDCRDHCVIARASAEEHADAVHRQCGDAEHDNSDTRAQDSSGGPRCCPRAARNKRRTTRLGTTTGPPVARVGCSAACDERERTHAALVALGPAAARRGRVYTGVALVMGAHLPAWSHRHRVGICRSNIPRAVAVAATRRWSNMGMRRPLLSWRCQPPPPVPRLPGPQASAMTRRLAASGPSRIW